jgi:hypothetical protein
MKTCSKCGKQKNLQEFACWRKGDATHKRNKCKECEKKSGSLLKESKKLAGDPTSPPLGTPCPICGQTSTLLCFDHDHETKKHRGWLCLKCNRAIGQLGDNIEGIKKALKYLQSSHSSTG